MTGLEWTQFCYNQHDVVCNQKYDNQHNYSFHLEMVRREAVRLSEGILTKEETLLALAGAVGHDLIEDARLTYNDIKDKVGIEVADIVYACTEEKGKNRKERHSDIFYTELAQNELAVFVKLCDIIANVKYSILTNSSMLEKYKSEYEKMHSFLFTAKYRYVFNCLLKLLAI